MAEYIKRETAINEIHRFRGYIDEDMEYRMKIAFNRLPAADVQPIKHGKWMTHYDESDNPFLDYCSACNAYLPWLSEGWQPNYCPMCGARCDL